MKNFENVQTAALRASNDGCIVISKARYISITGFSFQAREFCAACRENGYALTETPGTPVMYQYMDDEVIIQVTML